MYNPFQNTFNRNVRSKSTQKNHKKLTVKGGGGEAYGQPDRKISVPLLGIWGIWRLKSLHYLLLPRRFLLKPESHISSLPNSSELVNERGEQ